MIYSDKFATNSILFSDIKVEIQEIFHDVSQESDYLEPLQPVPSEMRPAQGCGEVTIKAGTSLPIKLFSFILNV